MKILCETTSRIILYCMILWAAVITSTFAPVGVQVHMFLPFSPTIDVHEEKFAGLLKLFTSIKVYTYLLKFIGVFILLSNLRV